MPLRLKGLLWFLPLGVGIYLMVAQPWNPLVALIAGVVLVATHGFVAAPFITANLDRHCIWSGREIAPGCTYKVTSGGATREYHSYSDQYREHASRLFTLSHKLFWPLRLAILLPLGFFVVMETLRLAGMPITSAALNHGVFLGVSGVVILLVAIGHRFIEPIPHNKAPVKYPLPISTVATLGIFWTLVVAGVAAAYGVYRATQLLLG